VNPEPVTITVNESHPGERLDAFLHQRLPDVSRSTLQRLIESGHIRVNDRHAKVTQIPRLGDRIDVTWPPPIPAEAIAQDIPLDILFEDEHLLVLNKPPGLVVHPAAGHEDGTLVNALLHHCAGQLSGIGGVARPGIVHRLDKDTSGCLVVAKTDPAHLSLAEQFAQRESHKVYQAIVCGSVKKDAGDIHAEVARHPTHRKQMAVVDGGGRDAWTGFRVSERLRGATWLEATLHTGRTHQIRVHFQHLGHPLVGDDTYGKRPNARLAEITGYRAPRQMLHAWRLGFQHPTTAQPMEFEAPLPADFQATLGALRS
jgi:23S rRNA pseudouridine1911/1915/1917 synthase